MRPISPRVRKIIDSDPFYKKCAISGRTDNLEMHHNLIFAGRQVDEAWAIIPLTKKIHDREKEKDIGAKLDWIMLNRATDEQLKKYSKFENLIAKRERLKRYEEMVWDNSAGQLTDKGQGSLQDLFNDHTGRYRACGEQTKGQEKRRSEPIPLGSSL